MRTLLLALVAAVPAEACDTSLFDGERGRTIPIRITLPPGTARVPVIFYSPGLGGGRAQGSVWAAAWAKAGFATVQFQHPGSDAEVYREAEAAAARQPDPAKARAARAGRIRLGTSGAQIAARLADFAAVHAVLSAPGGRAGGCRTARIDPLQLGVAGHSMGAWVAQIYAGQQLPGLVPRPLPVRAALAISGSALVPGAGLAESVRPVRKPFMLVTGTRDGVDAAAPPEAQAKALAERTALWAPLPPGGKMLLVADGATHMQLAGTPGETPAALAASVGALTSRFWLAALKSPAVAWPAAEALPAELRSGGPGDRFEQK
jgi:predicted dienelactone hydrolase